MNKTKQNQTKPKMKPISTKLDAPKRGVTPEANGGSRSVVISAPNIVAAQFEIRGTAPLVIHKFSTRDIHKMMQKMQAGSTAKKGTNRVPAVLEDVYNAARYISPEGWDGFNAAAIRAGLISACRLAGFKMTLAKLSLFVIADGYDAEQPMVPLIRIYGEPKRTEMVARVETGQSYVTIRPMYQPWSAKVRIRYDADQFTVDDVSNLLNRLGSQVGIGEGRPDSTNSAGMGWGTFEISDRGQCNE